MLSITVDTLVDENDGVDAGGVSLRDALAKAATLAGTDTIYFSPDLTDGTIALTHGQLVIDSDVIIAGPGQGQLTIDAQRNSRVFVVNSGKTATISGMTIKRGLVTGSDDGGGVYTIGDLTLDSVVVSNNEAGDMGGGIYVSTSGSLKLFDSTVDLNHATYGGGIFGHIGNGERLNVSGSTISNNTATGNGGGINFFSVASGGDAVGTIVNSTISNNTATWSGGLRARYSTTNVTIVNSTIAENTAGTGAGVEMIDSARVTLKNTISADNHTSGGGASNISGTLNIVDSYNNLIGPGGNGGLTNSDGKGNIELTTGQTAGLAPLGNYGGPTKTHALRPNSRAIDRGSNSAATGLSFDQRGLGRTFDAPVQNIGGNTIDIGAVEFGMLVAPEADFNGDSRDDDYAEYDPVTGNLVVYLEPNTAAVAGAWGKLSAGTWDTFRVGDFNGDGRDDLATRNSSGNWYFALSESTRFNVIQTMVYTTWTWAETVVGDFDGDGSQELLGWNPSLLRWQIVSYNDRSGAKLLDNWGNAVHGFVAADDKLYVGDANRDGRDDLVVRSASIGKWFVGLSQPTNGGTFSNSEQNWENWFTPYWNAQEMTVEIETPYQRILDIFSEVYNTFELEIYPGLMKGIVATAETKAGNDWDQAALLVDRLDAAGFQSQIVYGTVDAPLSEVREWLGVKSDGAAINVIKSALDNTAQLVGPALRFKHAWVQVNIPPGTVVYLDPSWKFKNRQQGQAVDLTNVTPNYTPVDGRPTRGSFDEFGYVANAGENQLPIEWYEDQVMNYLASSGANKSLADIAYDGPIMLRTFKKLPQTTGEILGSGAVVTTGINPLPFQNLDTILNNTTFRDRFVHWARISLQGNGHEHWFKDISIPEHSLSSIYVDYDKLENSPSTSADDTYRSRLYINNTAVRSSAELLNDNEDAQIIIRHDSPTEFQISPPAGVADDTYTRKAGQILAIGFDANQYSRQHIVALQDILNTRLEDDDDVADIDELLGYTAASYWYQFNRGDEAINSVMHTLGGQQWVGSGVVTSDPYLLTIPDTAIAHLQFPIVPHNMGVDLPNSTHISFDPETGFVDLEAFQLGGYNASALENAIIEEVVNSESVSTIRGLRNAYEATSNDWVWVYESVWENNQRKIYRRGAIGNNNNKPAYNSNGGTLVSTSQVISDLTTGTGTHTSTFASTIASVLANTNQNQPAAQAATIRVLVPRLKSTVGDWSGSVYVAEYVTSTGIVGAYVIWPDGGTPTQGGFSGNSVLEPNFTLPPATYLNQTSSGDPVNVANGNMYRDEVDFKFANPILPMDFARHYDSQNNMGVGLGIGWVHSFTGIVYEEPDPDPTHNNVKVFVLQLGNGERHIFEDATYTRPNTLFGEVTVTGSGASARLTQFRAKDGTKYFFEGIAEPFTNSGTHGNKVYSRLIAIENASGEATLDISYLPGNNETRVAKVTSNSIAGRYLEFTYGDTVVNNLLTHQVKRVEGNQETGVWTYFIRVDYPASPASPGSNGNRLVEVRHASQTSVVTKYDYHRTGPDAQKGLMSKVTEPNGEEHTYEYYANGRVFRVTDGEGNQQSYSYNLFRNLTEATDERGNVETYIHQDNGLTTRQVHDDRSRLEFTWGNQNPNITTDDHEEFLMLTSTDEVGAKETFTYYQPGDANYHPGDLKESVNKDLVRTRYEYSTAPLSYISALSKIIVDPDGSNINTEYTRDTFGRLLQEKDAEGNVTKYEYFDSSSAAHLRGLLKSQTQSKGVAGQTLPAGEIQEAVGWETLANSFSVTGNTLSIQLLSSNVAGAWVMADAVRIDRLDEDGVFSRIIDDDYSGNDPNFRLSSSSSLTNALHPVASRYGGDYVSIQSSTSTTPPEQVAATWVFTNLETGEYRVSATFALSGSTDSTTNYRIFNGLPGENNATPATVNQNQSAADFDFASFKTVFEYDTAGNVTKAVTEGLPASQRSYDAAGNVVSETDATGVRTDTLHDVLGRLQSSATYAPANPIPVGTTTYGYDPSGRLESSTDALGRQTQYDYDNNGRLTKTTFADETTIEHKYDEAGNRIEITDELGRVTRFVYDSRNRVVQTIFPDGSSTRTRYDGAGRVTASIDELGNTNDLIDEIGHTTEFTYDKSGRLLTTKRTLEYSGSLSPVTEPNTYDALGRLATQVDANGNTTSYQYDKLNRVIETRTYRAPSGTLEFLSTTRYDRNGNVAEQVVYDIAGLVAASVTIPPVDPTPLIASQPDLVQKVTYRYDAFGRVVEATNADLTKTSNIYDAAGRVRYTFDELGRKSELKYDGFGRLERTVAPDPDQPGVGGEAPPTRYVRDAFGNVIEEWQYFGQYEGRANVEHANRYVYDLRNRVVTTFEKDERHRTDVQYDKAGQAIATTDALGNTSYTKYDERGRVVQQRLADPDGGGGQIVPVTKHEYDPAGNRKSTTDPLGNTTSFDYDSLNRLRKESRNETIIADDSNVPDDVEFSVTSGGTYLPSASTAYGQDATIVIVPSPATIQQATWKFTNLAAGTYRVSIPSISLWSSANTIIYILDEPQGAPPIVPATTIGVQKTSPDFETVEGDKNIGWHWVRTSGGGVAEFTVTAQQVTDATGSEGVTRYVRLALGLSHAGQTFLADAVRIDRVVSRTYDYDDNGNLTRETDTRGYFTDYQYDAMNRRTKVTLPDPDGPGYGLGRLETESKYDGYGNLVQTIEYRAPGTTDDRINVYQYDQRNRRITETINSTGPNAERLVTTYKYDKVGNTTLVTDPLDHETYTRYDNLDRVIDQYENIDDGRPAETTTFSQTNLYLQPGLTGSADVASGTSGTLTLTGNVVAYAPITPYQVDFRTILEFNLKIDKPADYITIGFDNNQEFNYPGDDKRWFDLGGRLSFNGFLNTEFRSNVPLGQTVRVHLPIGQYLSDTEKTGLSINQLVFYTGTNGTPEPADVSKVVFSEVRLYPSDEVRTATTYDTRGNVETVITKSDPRNITTRYAYDLVGQRTREVLDELGSLERVYTTQYDPVGNVLVERNDSAGTETRHEYDRLGRLTKTTLPDPDGSAATPNGLVTKLIYDAAGNVIRQELGETPVFPGSSLMVPVETTRTAYDAQGRVTSQWDGNDDQTRYRYDSEGNLTRVTDAEQNVTTYTYDGLNRQTQEINAFGTRTHEYLIDANGNNFVRYYLRDGRKLHHYYSKLERLIKEEWYSAPLPPNGIRNLERTITFEYDKLGRVTRQIDRGGNGGDTAIHDDIVETFKYDGLGRLIEETNYNPDNLSQGSGTQTSALNIPDVRQTYEYVYEYVAGAGLWRDATYRTDFFADGTPIGKTLFNYDRLGRLGDASDFDANGSAGPQVAWKQTHFEYNTAGDLDLVRHYANYVSPTWQNVFDTTLVHDKAGRVSSITHDLPPAGTSATDIVHTYGYDNASRVVSFNTAGPTAATRTYGYDAAGQLTSKTGGTAESYTYDDNGNRTGSNGQGMAIGPANRLLADDTYIYVYDNEGNLVEKRLIAFNALVASYTWDHRNRLVSVTNWAAEPESRFVTYAYDVQGRRVKRTEGEVAEPQGAVKEYFVYNGDELAMRFGNAGELTHRYLYGPAVDQVLADETFKTVGTQRVSDDVLWQLADQQGTIRDVVDDTAALRRHVDYDSVGRITDEQVYLPDGTPDPNFPGSADQFFYYQGQPWDRTAQLYDFGARPYDPRTGRFLREDPLGFTADDANLYRAFGNSYPNRTDPTGLVQAGNPLSGLFGPSTVNVLQAAPSLANFHLTAAPRLAPLTTPVSTGYLAQSLLAPSPFSNPSVSTVPAAASVGPTSTFAGLGLSTLGLPTADQSLKQALPAPFPVSSLLPGQLREPRRVTSVEVLEGIHAGDVVRNTYNTLAAQHQQVADTTNSPLSAFGNQYAASLFRTLGRIEGAITDTFLPPSDPNVRIHYSNGSSITVLGGGPTTGALAGQALAIAQPILGNVSRPSGQLVLRIESGAAASAPSVAVQRTNAKLVQDIAARAEGKIGGTGPVAGTAKHIYARDVLRRYQRIFGDRGLQAEVSVMNRRIVDYGTLGSVRLDVLEGNVLNPTAIYDYKFGQSVLSTGRINQIQTVTGYGNTVPIIPVQP